MRLRLLALMGAAIALLWWMTRADEPVAPATMPDEQGATHRPDTRRASRAPLPALDTFEAPPERMPADAPVVATNLYPSRFIAPTLDTSDGAAGMPALQLGSLRMAPDVEALGATAQGFVPVGGDVPTQVQRDTPTIDITDLEELRFKREAGDLDNPIDYDEQIKRNAYGDGAVGVGDTSDGVVDSPSGMEIHVAGEVVDPADVPNPSAVERHTNGRRPIFDWRGAGLSPTEAGVVEVEDITRNSMLLVVEPVDYDTIVVDPVPTWDGEGTIPDGDP